MTYSRKIFALFFLIFFLSHSIKPLSTWANLTEEDEILILLSKNISDFELGTEGQYTIQDLKTNEIKTFPNRSILRVETNESGIKIGVEQWGKEVKVYPCDGEFLSFNNKAYRGYFILKLNSSNQITLINTVTLEEYLYGILPKEVPFDWPLEALKTQALISRTYALKNLGRHQEEGADFCNKVHCQVYGGKSAENENTNKAVDKTKDEVVSYHGDLIFSVFFSNCGGSTEKSLNVWAGVSPLPYLRSVHCGYCKNGNSYHWKKAFSQEQIISVLRNMGYEVIAPIRSISVAGQGNSGRAKFLNIKHGNGNVTVRASHLRLGVGGDLLRSTLIQKIQKLKDGFVLVGKGWGHGVGLCQDGARGLARKGKNYKQITQFYYPGTKVTTWKKIISDRESF